MRSLVLARDDVLRVRCFFVGVCFLQTEEHKNKRDTLIHECSYKWICSTFLNQWWASVMLGEYYSTFVERTKGDAYYLLLLLRMRCLHCKFFAWWARGCSGVSLLMHGLADGHHLHSCVLLFFCLGYLFASCLWWNCFCGCILFKWQKNIRLWVFDSLLFF